MTRKTRRIAYGVEPTTEADFKGAEVDNVYIDTERSRPHWIEFAVKLMRPGDTLVLRATSALGKGRGVTTARNHIEGKGVSIEIFNPDRGPKLPRGRPVVTNLTDDEWTILGEMWGNPFYSGGHVIDRARDLMGEKKNDQKTRERVRLRLNHKFGTRTQAMIKKEKN